MLTSRFVTPGYWALRLLIQTGGVVVPRNSSEGAYVASVCHIVGVLTSCDIPTSWKRTSVIASSPVPTNSPRMVLYPHHILERETFGNSTHFAIEDAEARLNKLMDEWPVGAGQAGWRKTEAYLSPAEKEEKRELENILERMWGFGKQLSRERGTMCANVSGVFELWDSEQRWAIATAASSERRRLEDYVSSEEHSTLELSPHAQSAPRRELFTSFTLDEELSTAFSKSEPRQSLQFEFKQTGCGGTIKCISPVCLNFNADADWEFEISESRLKIYQFPGVIRTAVVEYKPDGKMEINYAGAWARFGIRDEIKQDKYKHYAGPVPIIERELQPAQVDAYFGLTQLDELPRPEPVCNDTCVSASNGICEDGGSYLGGSKFASWFTAVPPAIGGSYLAGGQLSSANVSLSGNGLALAPSGSCSFGTDCSDCGLRYREDLEAYEQKISATEFEDVDGTALYRVGELSEVQTYLGYMTTSTTSTTTTRTTTTSTSLTYAIDLL